MDLLAVVKDFAIDLYKFIDFMNTYFCVLKLL
jgi:hypothetical protein